MAVNLDPAVEMLNMLKQKACDAIDTAAADLNSVSQEIWNHPEEKFQEHHAHKILTDYLEQHGFPVERHYVLETGFRSLYGEVSQPNVAVLCEYDSLPGIGHACGHNLIAEAGLGAAIGIKAALDAATESGQQLGRLTVLGTPAEEGGGGKIDMLEGDAFKSIDAAMMVHPFPHTEDLAGFIARDIATVTYHGKASHAAAFPWEGVNALDAAVMAYTSISVLRQQLKPGWMVHGIISNGGAKPNIIPEETELNYYVRAPNMKGVEVVKKKVNACFRAAAEATGCTVDIDWCAKPYESLLSCPTLDKLYTSNCQGLGVSFPEGKPKLAGSTDMGNVSHALPSIHPVFAIGTNAAIHTRDFTAAAGSSEAQPATLNQAKVLACTAIDIYCQKHLVNTMKTELKELLALEQA